MSTLSLAYRHAASGAIAKVTARTWSYGQLPVVRLELLSDPRGLLDAGDEAYARSPFKHWHQDHQLLICCALGEHALGNRCPIHGSPARSQLPGRKVVLPIEIPERQLDAEWEPVQ